jgi:hypothetical protein
MRLAGAVLDVDATMPAHKLGSWRGFILSTKTLLKNNTHKACVLDDKGQAAASDSTGHRLGT